MKITQKVVVDAMLRSRTAEQVKEAQRLRNEWVAEHPNDESVWEISAGLERKAYSLGLPSALDE